MKFLRHCVESFFYKVLYFTFYNYHSNKEKVYQFSKMMSWSKQKNRLNGNSLIIPKRNLCGGANFSER